MRVPEGRYIEVVLQNKMKIVTNLTFTELSWGARYSSKGLTCTAPFNAHNDPMRYIFSSPWFIPAENPAREVRLHTLGKRSRDQVRDANPGLALGGGSHHCLGIGYPPAARPSLSPPLALGQDLGSIPPLAPKPHALLRLLQGEAWNSPER